MIQGFLSLPTGSNWKCYIQSSGFVPVNSLRASLLARAMVYALKRAGYALCDVSMQRADGSGVRVTLRQSDQQ